METNEYEGGTGGKFRKRPLRRVPHTPYDRPPLANLGIRGGSLSESESGRSGWFSKLIDPAARVIVNNASRLFSSVFGKGIAIPQGENINASEEALEVRFSPELIAQDVNSGDVRLSIHDDGCDRSELEIISGNDSIFELEQLLKQKRFSRVETEQLTKLLQSAAIEPTTLPPTDIKNKGKADDYSNIDPNLSHQIAYPWKKEKEKKNASVLELKGQRDQLSNQHGNANIHDEGFGSPIEIARAYMGSKPLRAPPSTLSLQNQISHWDKASLSNLPFGSRLTNAATASKSSARFPIIPSNSGNPYITPKSQGRSALYRLSRTPYENRSLMMTNPRYIGPYEGSWVEPTKSFEWLSSSNFRPSGHGQALKRGISNTDLGCFDDGRRVRQRSNVKESNFSSHTDIASTSFLGQEYKSEADLMGAKNLEGRLPSESIFHAPSQSIEMARKILYQLDKLKPSPNKSLKKSEKKGLVGAESFFKPSFTAFQEGSLNINANSESAKLVDIHGSRILEYPNSSNSARISSSASPSKFKAEVEASPLPSLLRSEPEPSSYFQMSSSMTSTANAKSSQINSNSEGTMFSTKKKQDLLIAPDDKVKATPAERASILSVKEPRKETTLSSLENVPVSGSMLAESSTKSLDIESTGKNANFTFFTTQAFNTMSVPHLSATIPTLAERATPKEEDFASSLKFISQGSTDNATISLSTGNKESSLQIGETVLNCPTSEPVSRVSSTPALVLDNSVSSSLFTSIGTSVTSNSTLLSSSAPTFHFGSGNSTNHSFAGLSGISASTGNGAPKFQFGSGNSSSYSFTGVPSISSSTGIFCTTPLSPSFTEGSSSLSTSFFPISANGAFDVNTSSASVGSSPQFSNTSSQNTDRNFDATAASFFETQKTYSGIGVMDSTNNSRITFGLGSSLQASSSPQIGFAMPGAKPYSFGSNNNSTLFPAAPPSFSASSYPSLSPSSFNSTSTSTLFSSPSTLFSFGMRTNASGSAPFASASSSSISPLASTGTIQPVFRSITGFTSGSPSNDEMITENTIAGSNLQDDPNAPTVGQSNPSVDQIFKFGTYQNNSALQNSSPFQASTNAEFSVGGSFSLGSGGGDKSERRFIRVKRDNLKRK